MKESKLIELINTEEKWFKINTPPDLHSAILTYIGNKYFINLKYLRFFKAINTILISLVFIFSSIFVFQIFFGQKTRVVFIYPHSGIEKKVYVITKSDNEEKKIPLELDEEKGIWKAIFHNVNLNTIEDIEFLVEEFPQEELE
ncbi:MAG: hypothetical protein N2258_09050 [Brevinematales bacterium]|nr:hypothetical protein [Brevinematales bacterium]